MHDQNPQSPRRSPRLFVSPHQLAITLYNDTQKPHKKRGNSSHLLLNNGGNLLGRSPRLIGSSNDVNYSDCTRNYNKVSKSSDKLIKFCGSVKLGLDLNNSAVGFDGGSKCGSVKRSSRLIGSSNECSSYNKVSKSKSSGKLGGFSGSMEFGLNLNNSGVGFDGGSKCGNVKRSSRLIGSANGVNSSEGNRFKVSKSSGKMVECSESRKLGLDLSNGGLEFSGGSISENVKRSPRLIGSSNGVHSNEFSGFKVSKSSGKMVRCSKSRNLGLGLHNCGIEGSESESESKTLKNKVLLLTYDKSLRRSPRLMDSSNGGSFDGECSRYTKSNSSGKMVSGLNRLGFALNSASCVNGKRELYALLSSQDQVKTHANNKKLKKSDSRNREGVRFLSRFSTKTESFVEVEENLGGKESSQLIKPTDCHESEGELGMKSSTPCLSMLENLEEKVLRRSPRGLPSTFAVEDDDEWDEIELRSPKKSKKKKVSKEESKVRVKKSDEGGRTENCFFIGEPVSEEEALQRWGWRYQLKNRRINGRSLTGNDNEDDEPILKVKAYYTQAQINGCIYHVGDCAFIRGDNQKLIGRIVEFFQTEDEDYFRVQWFYKPEDTVMKEAASFHDEKRLFYSGIMNDNLLACIISKVNVIQVAPQLNYNSSSSEPSDFYYDMEYCLDYSTFRNLPRDFAVERGNLPSLGCHESTLSLTSSSVSKNSSICETNNAELTMLDLYAGCGGMSTGLCIGARIADVNLVTRWAVDADSSACESLRLNHSKVEVKNETAEDFLELLKQWERLRKKFVSEETLKKYPSQQEASDLAESCSDAQSDIDDGAEELEVASLVDICYGDTDGSSEQGLKFKVRWKGFGPDEDTWEPIEGLSNCQDLIQEFVINGVKNKILPLPGDVDVICGGPPCQGISGYNRFRSVEAPLEDEKNRQLVVFMDIVEYLKPKFVLMENVMDILRFDKGSLGRYALSRLVHMSYQARVGIMAAGCYGLPQFRLRAFFWGALPSEELPQFPLPTHDVVVRYWPPAEFERNVVAYDEDSEHPELDDAVLLGDAISDLPAVTNHHALDEMPYTKPPESEFQKYIRSTKYDKIHSDSNAEEDILYDHCPHQLFEDDYVRVCQIPRRKGANFRDLPGVIVGEDNVVRRDPTIETEFLPSGMPLVPEYAFTFEQGKSKRPFARLWWDENVATIVTYPNCHSSAVLHPEQDRVLTVRECARLQGFPDCYRFSGTVKQRYRQVGNAVAIPVAKALGYSLGLASQRLIGKEPLLTLPPKFAYSDHL